MQTDVKSAHLNQTGFMVSGRVRVKALSVKGSESSISTMEVYSTSTAPVAATYAQTGLVVTITKTAHGLKTGDTIGVSFTAGTGGTSTDGNYVVTVLTSSTFTIPNLNVRTITAGATCNYVANGGVWLMSFNLVAGDTYQNYFPIPGEGVLAPNGVYVIMTNLAAATIFYG
jgi:hypothetical protein